ncbi:PST family polysaccharide transporter [Lacticaseibacillus paracasei subsp. paracasei Lpp126]|uniref:PST family polysaccharide transporter n=1 Tax=Lacticaseibacillus paracasei subsp. paracasei Lpp126 TaxID=1256206 RepID=S2R348_LACPA|nr:PST family polysaccharide transporter [Lacticaseibacillus paracasei subsp. paracasei Lpp126]
MKIVKNYLYNVGYQVFILIVPLLTTPYISRVLGSYGVGVNAYTNSVVTYFVLFGSIGVTLYGNRTIAYERDDFKKRSQSFWEINFMRFITIIGAYVAFGVFFMLTDKYQEFYLAQSWQILAAALDISWFFMGLEDFGKTVLRNFAVKIVSVVMIFMFVKNAGDINLYILILTLSTLFGNLTLWPYMRRYVRKPDWSNLHIWRHLRPSLALFVPQIATQIYLVLNKTMLGSMDGVDSSGYYEYADRIVKLVLAVVTATGTVMLPRMANTFAKKDFKKLNEYLYRSFDFVTLLSVPMAFGTAAVAPKFAPWFMGQEFAITGKLIPIESIIIVMIAWSNALGTQYLLPVGKNKEYTISVTGGAVANLILNIPLILWLGVYGAVVSTVVSEILVSGIQVFFMRRTVDVSRMFSDLPKYLVCAIGMGIVVYVLSSVMPSSFLSFTAQIVVGMIVYLILILIARPRPVHYLKKLL